MARFGAFGSAVIATLTLLSCAPVCASARKRNKPRKPTGIGGHDE